MPEIKKETQEQKGGGGVEYVTLAVLLYLLLARAEESSFRQQQHLPSESQLLRDSLQCSPHKKKCSKECPKNNWISHANQTGETIHRTKALHNLVLKYLQSIILHSVQRNKYKQLVKS